MAADTMIETLLRWAARTLAAILEKFADPELQKKLDGFNKQVAEVEAKEREAARLEELSKIAYEDSLRRREGFDLALQESQRQEIESIERLNASKTRVAELEAQNQKTKDDIDRMSDADALRKRL